MIAGHGPTEQIFDYTAAAVNGLAFPVGIAVVMFLARPVVRGLGRCARGEPVAAEDLKWLRRRCLCLGHYAAGIGVGLWALAGPVYPVAILLGVGTLSLQVVAFFVVSLVLGGLIAAAYPFFGVTYLWVLVLYPPLVQPASTTLEDVAWLERLGIFTWRYLLLAASLPMLVITLALWVGSPHQRALLAALCLGSLVGLGVAFWLCRGLQRSLKILKQAVARSHPGRGACPAKDQGLEAKRAS